MTNMADNKAGWVDRTELMYWVEQYLAMGFVILPVRDKRPLVAWGDWSQHPPSPDEQRGFFQEHYEKLNGVAVHLGASNLCCLDVDNEQAFLACMKELGIKVPPNGIVITKRGYHIYFKCPPELASVNVLKVPQAGFELLAGNHIAVLPPSAHPEGGQYQFRHKFQGAPAEMPEKLKDYLLGYLRTQKDLEMVPTETVLQSLTEPAPEAPSASTPTETATVLTEPVRAALTTILLPHWQEGQRHDLSLAVAGVLAKRGVPYEEALAFLSAIADQAKDTEFKDRFRAFKDTYERLQQGKQVKGWQGLKELLPREVVETITRLLAPSETEQEISTNHKKGAKGKGILAGIKLPPPPEIPFVLLEKEVSVLPTATLISKVLPREGVTILAGRPKVGKSIVAALMAAAVSKGTDFLGRRTYQAKVLYLPMEAYESTLNRLHQLQAGIFVPPPAQVFDLDALNFIAYPDITIAPLKEKGIRLIIVDPMVRFLQRLKTLVKLQKYRTENISDYELTYEILSELNDIAHNHNLSFLIIHHNRKANPINDEDFVDAILGTTAITGSVDQILVLKAIHTDPVTKQKQLTLSSRGRDLEELSLTFLLDPANLTAEPLSKEHRSAPRAIAYEIFLELLKENRGKTLSGAYLRHEIEIRLHERGVKVPERSLKRYIHDFIDLAAQEGQLVITERTKNTLVIAIPADQPENLSLSFSESFADADAVPEDRGDEDELPSPDEFPF